MKALATIPPEIKKIFAESDQYFPTALQKFQFFDKYSKFDWEKMRRETWVETVDRSVEFLKKLSQNKLSDADYQRIRKGILEMKATPSMRLLAMAGPAAERNNICLYNCSYLPIDDPQAWVEALIISMCGCGVGYSVESVYVNQLPKVKKQSGKVSNFVIPDDMEGWAEALRVGLNAWFNGEDVTFDFSQLRPAGTPLKTKGGHSSGPKVLEDMLEYIRLKILSKQDRKLTTLDAHDIMTRVGDASISGGVRRTAMIALFDMDDELMIHCKDGDLEHEVKELQKLDKDDVQYIEKRNQLIEATKVHRYNANNSAVWPERKLTQREIADFMMKMVNSERGEPGVFSRRAARNRRPVRRKDAVFGTNPCGEIVLRPFQFCNLTIAVARHEDTLETLREKVELATIIGTIQSAGTHFPGLRKIWQENCEEERLLGVDITGQQDSPVAQDPSVLAELRHHAYEVNKKYAKILGIQESTAITCNKPSGNSSQLFDCSSGIHSRWAPYYVRNVRVNAHGPVRKVLEASGVTLIPDRGKTYEEADMFVVGFPVKSPNGAKTRNDRSAVEQANYWLTNKIHWTEHNPSCTVTYRPDEVIDLIKWVYDNQELVGGLSFLPAFDANYPLMPYEEITKEKYEELVTVAPQIDFSLLYEYEKTDMTEAAQLLACMGGACELEDYQMAKEQTNKNSIPNGKLKLIKFYADWCQPCKQIKDIVHELVNEEDLELEEINIDKTDQNIANYGVMSIPTLLLFDGDVEKGRAVGQQSKDSYKKALNLL